MRAEDFQIPSFLADLNAPLGGQLSGGQLSGGQLSGGQLSGGQLSGVNCRTKPYISRQLTPV